MRCLVPAIVSTSLPCMVADHNLLSEPGAFATCGPAVLLLSPFLRLCRHPGCADNASAWCSDLDHHISVQDVKYGTVSTSALIRDLWTWDSMFMAGRLHKPVLYLAEDALINEAMSANLDSALAAALLFLPARFTSQVCG